MNTHEFTDVATSGISQRYPGVVFCSIGARKGIFCVLYSDAMSRIVIYLIGAMWRLSECFYDGHWSLNVVQKIEQSF